MSLPPEDFPTRTVIVALAATFHEISLSAFSTKLLQGSCIQEHGLAP